MSPACRQGVRQAGAAVPRVLCGRYAVRGCIGRGSSATVHRATDLCHGRDVAVKMPRPDSSRDGLRWEGAVWQALEHPNIARILDQGEHDGVGFLVVELLEGGSLREVVMSGHALGGDRVAALLGGPASALAFMHAVGIVHGDVKPGNLLFDLSGVVKLIDFGAAHRLTDRSWFAPAATPGYTAPDILFGATPEPSDDVFSLGVVAYELLAGRHPFDRGAPVTGQEPVPPPGLAREGRAWLGAALSAERDDRPRDPCALVAALRDGLWSGHEHGSPP